MTALAIALVCLVASLLAWDAFRRHLADRRDARAVQRQEGASTERLDHIEEECVRTGKNTATTIIGFENRILSLERAQMNPKAARR